MINHYYTLFKITEELKSLIGLKVVECFSQEKNNLLIGFYDGSDVVFVHFSTDTKFGSIYLKSRFYRSNSNSVDLFPELPGQILQNVNIANDDRIITFEFTDMKLDAVLFGGSRSNLILKTKDDSIISSFKSKRKFAETATGNDLTSSTILEYLTKSYPFLGKYYGAEFLHLNNIESGNILEVFSKEELDRILLKAADFRNEILAAKKYYLLRGKNGKLLLSLIPLITSGEVIESFDSISKGIEFRVRKEIIESGIIAAKKNVLPMLRRMQHKIQTNIEQIKEKGKNPERAEKYKHWADILSSHPNQKLKPGKSIKVEDWEGNPIDVPLNPELNLNENARKLYEKASDANRSIKIREQMLPSLSAKLEKINAALNKFENAESIKEINKIMDEYKDLINYDPANPEKGSKFREFDLGEGYILYVGKNAANNDELTVKFAKPNDLWLHARGTSGSHAVLRLNKDEKPPKYILQKAASVTAYYSGAKNAKYVPVCYTLKKNVHKPKGANPGSVVLSREDVIMAEPRLPKSEE